MNVRRAVFRTLLLLIVAGGFTVVYHRTTPEPSPDPPLPEWIQTGVQAVREQVEGFVVFERLGEEHLGIWLQKLGQTNVTCIAPYGRYPRISQDGKIVYFLQQDGILCEVILKNGEIHTLLQWPERIPAISVHPINDEIYFISESALYLFDHVTSQVSRIEPAPKKVAAVDIDAAGDLVISTHDGLLYEIWKQRTDQRDNIQWDWVDTGCSAAISPDGLYFTDNENSHRFIDIRTFNSNEAVFTIRTHPQPYRVDNETWTNLDDWLVFVSQDPQRRFVWLYRLGEDHPLKVTFTRDADRPDAYLTHVKPSRSPNG